MSTAIAAYNPPERVAGQTYSEPVVVTGVVQMAVVTNPTDAFLIGLSSFGKAAELVYIDIDGDAAAAGEVPVLLQRSPNGGLPGSYQTLNGPQIDSYDGPSGTALSAYALDNANRSVNGNGVSTNRPLIRSGALKYRATGSDGRGLRFEFGNKNVKGPLIRHISEYFCVNLAGLAQPSTAKLTITAGLILHDMVQVEVIGDSTVSQATQEYLNGGSGWFGGMGETGQLNSRANIDNLGSNGYRLVDFLLGLNGVTWSLQQVQSRSPDIHVFAGYLMNDFRTGLCGLNQGICLLDTYIYASRNGTTVNEIYQSPKATVSTIQSISWSGGTVTVNFAAAHGFVVGGQVYMNIAGVTPAGYNGHYAVTVVDADTVTYALAGDPGAATVMGTGAYAIKFAHAIAATPDVIIIMQGPTGVTADDAGNGPFYYLSAAGNTTLSGLWTGLTLAQAAYELTEMLYDAYQAFKGDPRGEIHVIQRQDIKVRSPVDGNQVYAFPSKKIDGVTVPTNANTPTTGTKLSTMANQIHASARGERLSFLQVLPVLEAAITRVETGKV